MQMQLVPEFINQPKPGSKFGSIKAGSVYYGVSPTLLGWFQTGVPILVDVEAVDKNGTTYHNIRSVVPPGQGAAPAPQPQPVVSPPPPAPVQPLPAQVINPAPSNGHVSEKEKSEDIAVQAMAKPILERPTYPVDETSLTQLFSMIRRAWRASKKENGVPF